MVISRKFARFKGNHCPGLRPLHAPCFMDNQRDLRVFMDKGTESCSPGQKGCGLIVDVSRDLPPPSLAWCAGVPRHFRRAVIEDVVPDIPASVLAWRSPRHYWRGRPQRSASGCQPRRFCRARNGARYHHAGNGAIVEHAVFGVAR